MDQPAASDTRRAGNLLLWLPRELRDQIYSYFVQIPHDIFICSYYVRNPYGSTVHHRYRLHADCPDRRSIKAGTRCRECDPVVYGRLAAMPLLRLCKTIGQEALQVLYGNNVFCFTSLTQCSNFVQEHNLVNRIKHVMTDCAESNCGSLVKNLSTRQRIYQGLKTLTIFFDPGRLDSEAPPILAHGVLNPDDSSAINTMLLVILGQLKGIEKVLVMVCNTGGADSESNPSNPLTSNRATEHTVLQARNVMKAASRVLATPFVIYADASSELDTNEAVPEYTKISLSPVPSRAPVPAIGVQEQVSFHVPGQLSLVV